MSRRALQPPLMSVPLVLWTASFAMDLASLRYGNEFVRAAFYSVAVGVAVAIVISASTMLDYNRVPANSPTLRVTLLHGVFLASSIVVFAIDSWIRALWIDARQTPFPAVACSALGLMMMGVVGFLRRQVDFDGRGNVIRLVRPASEAPPGTIPFRPRRP